MLGAAEPQAHHDYVWPLIKQLLPTESGLRILDAGCGTGFLSAQLAALGHCVTGVDASGEAIRQSRQCYTGVRFEVLSVYDDLSDLEPGGWDVVVAAELVEHLYSPKQFLQNMHRHLRKDGLIVLTTPYHGYVKNLAISLLNRWDRHFGVHWDGGHIKFFSPSSLRRQLEANGFSRLEFRYAGRLPFFWKSMACRAARV